ncbi:MAG: hypothetical protein MPL62_07765 [Alphaproteobacteria bacterium]|nr:hypothetical protein [Alphaproteobacteria bacterium]
MNHLRLSIPHPVLSSINSDYRPSCRFDSDIKLEPSGTKMILSIRYTLSSDMLKKYISAGKAKYFLVAKCAKTFRRDVHSTDDARSTWELDMADYEGKIILTPYIASVGRLPPFISTEHLADMHDFGSDGFDLPPGSILAMADPYVASLRSGRNTESIMSLMVDESIGEGEFAIDLNEEYIQIKLGRETYARVNALRKHPSKGVLYPSLYLAAIEHAIREMTQNRGNYEEHKWAESLASIMSKKGLEVEEGQESSSIHRIAQALLEGPLSRMLESVEEDEDA